MKKILNYHFIFRFAQFSDRRFPHEDFKVPIDQRIKDNELIKLFFYLSKIQNKREIQYKYRIIQRLSIIYNQTVSFFLAFTLIVYNQAKFLFENTQKMVRDMLCTCNQS